MVFLFFLSLDVKRPCVFNFIGGVQSYLNFQRSQHGKLTVHIFRKKHDRGALFVGKFGTVGKYGLFNQIYNDGQSLGTCNVGRRKRFL